MNSLDPQSQNSQPKPSVFGQINHNWMFATATKITLLCFVAAITLIIWRYNMLPPQIPLWYSRVWGTDRLAQPWWLFMLAGSVILWHVINLILALTVLRPYRVFIQILFIASTFVSVLMLIAITKILVLVS